MLGRGRPGPGSVGLADAENELRVVRHAVARSKQQPATTSYRTRAETRVASLSPLAALRVPGPQDPGLSRRFYVFPTATPRKRSRSTRLP